MGCIAFIGYHQTYLFFQLYGGYVPLPELNIAYLKLLRWVRAKGFNSSNRFMKRFSAPNLSATLKQPGLRVRSAGLYLFKIKIQCYKCLYRESTLKIG